MHLSEFYKLFKQSGGVSTDTRAIKPGTIFFALKGDNFNGNKFADKALEAGASYAVVDDKEQEGPNKILVDDALSYLQQLARHHRRQLQIPVISLTGSNGKTTTKEMMAAVMSSKYKVCATKGNLNNHIGVPLTLLSISEDDEFAIVEMGANHQKEIEFLCALAEPDFGYITNFGKAHLEGFGGVEGVIIGKSELYDFLRTRENGKVFLNIDDRLQIRQSHGIEAISFGSSADSDYKITLSEDSGDLLKLHFSGLSIQSRLTGDYNFSNVAAAICVGSYFDVPTSMIKDAIEAYIPSNNRSQIEETEFNKLIIDAYNANPSSIEAALKNFQEFEANHKWVILGDMFEMGAWSAEEHQRIADLAQKLGFEKVILAGKDFYITQVGDLVHRFQSTDDVIEFLKEEKPTGKTVLIKGSRGMAMERLVPFL